MANLSDANVTLEAKGCGNELVDYINATNADPTDYAIVYGEFDDTYVDENNDATIESNSSGRWAYENNLEGYFSSERVKSWLGVDSDFEWAANTGVKDKYRKQTSEQYAAYLKLVEAIKKGGKLEITYTDNDPAMRWCAEGVASLELIDGEVVFNHSSESEDLTIERYCEMERISVIEAIEILYGDEALDSYRKYQKNCKEKGTKEASADEWYDNIYEEEE